MLISDLKEYFRKHVLEKVRPIKTFFWELDFLYI
jgi:hypothetical protein